MRWRRCERSDVWPPPGAHRSIRLLPVGVESVFDTVHEVVGIAQWNRAKQPQVRAECFQIGNVKNVDIAGEPVADIRITTTVPLVSEDTLGVPVSDATVWLERDDVRFDLIATAGAAGTYHYPGSDLVIASGEIFELGISRGSESISATTVVPPPPEGFAVSSDVMDVVDLTAGGQ